MIHHLISNLARVGLSCGRVRAHAVLLGDRAAESKADFAIKLTPDCGWQARLGPDLIHKNQWSDQFPMAVDPDVAAPPKLNRTT
jgi:hypothetical protein